ncbi:MAG: peptidylprolyl isomerase [Nitrospiraceae bacterium]|nr:peptidylprolyl isomerase [Nitrospiraceae bacterium]
MAGLLFVLPQGVSADDAVATVGDAKISAAMLAYRIKTYIPPGVYHGDIPEIKVKKYRESALGDLIEVELLYKMAKAKGVVLPDGVVEGLMKKNVEQAGSEEKFRSDLAAMGLTPEAFAEQSRRLNTANMLLGEIYKESAPSDKEIADYYETNKAKYRKPDSMRLYHILVKVEATATPDEWKKAEKRAKGLLKKIKSGADFGRVAYDNSDDPYRYKSGDLGVIHRGQLTPPELDDAAFGLKEGELSNVIQTIHGFHIMKAGEHHKGSTLSLDDVRDKIRSQLQIKSFEAKRNALLEEAKAKFPVTIIPEAVRPETPAPAKPGS